MSVTLTPEQEREVAERVAGGRYPSGEAVIRAALSALREREEHEARRAALLADLDAGLTGPGVPLTRELLDDLKADGRTRLAERAGHG